jgi:hypothetical protein
VLPAVEIGITEATVDMETEPQVFRFGEGYPLAHETPKRPRSENFAEQLSAQKDRLKKTITRPKSNWPRDDAPSELELHYKRLHKMWDSDEESV